MSAPGTVWYCLSSFNRVRRGQRSCFLNQNFLRFQRREHFVFFRHHNGRPVTTSHLISNISLGVFGRYVVTSASDARK